MTATAFILFAASAIAMFFQSEDQPSPTSASADDGRVRVTITIDRGRVAPGENLSISASCEVLADGALQFPSGNSQPLAFIYVRMPNGNVIAYPKGGGSPKSRRAFGIADYSRPLNLSKNRHTSIIYSIVSMVNPSPGWVNPDTFDAVRPNFRTVGEYEAWVKYTIPKVDGAPVDAWQGTVETERVRFTVREIHLANRRAEVTPEQAALLEAYIADTEVRLSGVGVRPKTPAAVETPEWLSLEDRLQWALERTENEAFARHTVALLREHQPKDYSQPYPNWWSNVSFLVRRRAHYDGPESSLRILGPYLDDYITIALVETERQLAGPFAPTSGNYVRLLLDFVKYQPDSPVRQKLEALARQYAKLTVATPPRDPQVRNRLGFSWRMLFTFGILRDGMPLIEATNILGEPTWRRGSKVAWDYKTGSRAIEHGVYGDLATVAGQETIAFSNRAHFLPMAR